MDYNMNRDPDYMNLQNVEDLNRIESQLDYYTREMNQNLNGNTELAGMQAYPAQPAMAVAEEAQEMDPDTQAFMAQGYMMNPRCFGQNSARYGPQLIDFINDEYRDYKTYASMAAHAPSAEARRTLRRTSGEELRHGKMFSTAYFIITGKKYTPGADVRGERNDASFSQQLRERYIAEINGAMEYRRFAQQVTDPCLQRMAAQAADDERRHAGEIMELLRDQ